MTKKQTIEKIGKKYIEKLMLQLWDIDFVLSKDYTNDDGAAATAKINAKYRQCTVTVFKCAFVKPNNVDHIIKHELCHCLTEPIYLICYDFMNSRFRTHYEIEEQRELLTEWIARII